ncbi:Aste57867_10065 [Aphanomyces stellatus]|uniref:Aste57867_10065 protein n=1 Tax=Aphanomyces stellatus TaxID=120398 RepID=A0A485KQC8_9STRA|nr:hypothetical protein As57867_010026 [Aphanomyces stellatus]VFT86941.1 Aste57867_10065 [Aphanomyces stellatus]
MSSTHPQQKQIVVIGGGYIGIQFAQELAKLVPASHAAITVIEKNEFTYHAMGVPRAFVDPSYVPKLFIPLAHALPASHSKVIRGMAESIEANHVLVRPIVDNQLQERTTSVPFDYLILATGSTYASPIKVAAGAYTREGIERAVVETAARIKAASSVLIVGGGPVGIEVAGEIAAAYPDKKVTILDAHAKLVSNSGLNDKFRATLGTRLTQLGVKLVLGERLSDRVTEHGFDPKTVVTDRGTQIASDVQLVCAGMTPNTAWIRKFDASLLDDHHAVRVTPALQVDDPRFANMFAIGDVNNHPTPKLAYTGAIQAKHMARQLAKLIKKGSGNIAPFVVSGGDAMLVPLGPNGGVAQLPLFGGIVAGDMIVRAAKAKDYFAGKMWGTWHASLP